MFKSIMNSIFLVESLKSAKEFATKHNVSQDVFDGLNALDTTPTKKLIHQMLKWTVDTETRGANGGITDSMEELSKELDTFIKFSGGRIKEPIEKFKTFKEFKEFITPFLDIETKADKKDALAGQYKKVFENDNMLVVIPFTHKASCIYGAKTKWCTTAKTAQYFNDYQEQGNSIYYVINKKDTDEKNKFHKMAVVVDKEGKIEQCFDTFDTDMYTRDILTWIKANGIPNIKSVFKPIQKDPLFINAIKFKYIDTKAVHLYSENYDTIMKLFKHPDVDKIFPVLNKVTFDMYLAEIPAILPKLPTSVKKVVIDTNKVTDLKNINTGNVSVTVTIYQTYMRTFKNCENIPVTFNFVGYPEAFMNSMDSIKTMFKSKFKKINATTKGIYRYGYGNITKEAVVERIKEVAKEAKSETPKIAKKKINPDKMN